MRDNGKIVGVIGLAFLVVVFVFPFFWAKMSSQAAQTPDLELPASLWPAASGREMIPGQPFRRA